ncbi:efflux RND transporter permease subunit [Halomonas sp. PA16-9]|uniref:efflux RND transporter permease subunit n=1 Tax=Halomonas sp. PA16-9 TaxID=2576841 RepID=UPI003FA5E1E2
MRVGGGSDYAMRVWLDRNALAARGLTVSDIEDALRAENVELRQARLNPRIGSLLSASPVVLPVPKIFSASPQLSKTRRKTAIWCALLT